MKLKTSIILIICAVIITAAITYFITHRTFVYNPLDDPDIQKVKHETELKDSLNNEIIEILKERIDDKQFVIDNFLLKEIEQSKNKVKEFSLKRVSETKYIKSLDEAQLERDINLKIAKRKN
jgi:uncharacterized ion transporter superfamily protein YfcC